MQCSRCAKQGMVEIRMKIAGEDVMFHSCGRCESKVWSSQDGPMSLDRVLDMARTH
jgi:hypothetical protein